MSDQAQDTCPNCETPLNGKFCSACGQKIHEPNERTLKYFVFQFFGSAFFLENNFLKNLWVLLTKPGLHTLDFIEGRSKRWMTPFSLFLLINLIYFILNPLSDFSLSLHNQVYLQPHSQLAKKMVDDRLTERQVSFEDYASEYQAQSDGLTKTLIILNAPISALFFMIWFFRRKMFFADHFIYFVHFYGFLLLTAILLSGLAFALHFFNLVNMGNGLGLFLLIASILYYLTFSIRRVYAQRSIVFLMMGLVFALATIFVTHIAYRFILFMVTFYTT